MQIKEFTFNFFGEITRILWENPGFAVIVDPGCCTAREKDSLYSFIEGQGLKPCAVLLTHAHFDHITGVFDLQRNFDIPVYMDPAEEKMFAMSDRFSGKAGFPVIRTDWKYIPVKDGDILDFGGMQFEVISTPGHSPGSVCYLNRKEGILLSGDTLFAGSIGRTDLDEGDYDSLIRSIMEKLVWLDGSTRVLPGHGPESTIGIERVSNPFLEPFNEKEELEN